MNRALVIDDLRRAREVMSIVFGESFRDVFTKYINDIMDVYSLYDGEYLRYMAEEVLYRYCEIMSDTWSVTQASFYNVANLYEAGNAAKLLTIMVSKILPSLTMQQEYLRSVSGKITRTLPAKSSSTTSNNQFSSQKKKAKPSLPTTNIQLKRKVSTPTENLCLPRLRFKI